MPRILVTVPKLKVRDRVPPSFPDSDHIVGIVKNGYEFDGEEVNGQEVIESGTGTWYKDIDDHFFWGAGVTVLQDTVTIDDPEIPRWMIELRIPQIWKLATGKNVGIAIVDTGIDSSNPNFNFSSDKFFLYNGGESIHDRVEHGTHCSGLASSKNNPGQKFGVAFDAKLYVCKIADADFLNEPDTIRYADAINWCADQPEVNVISISWASFINNQSIEEKIQAAIDKAVSKNKVVVCAMGDASQFNDPGPVYPVCLQQTIGVGSIPVEDLLYPYINEFITISITGFGIKSFGLNNQVKPLTGTSQSNAIIAGIIALMMEKNNFNITPQEIKNTLLRLSTIQTINDVKMAILSGELLLNYFKS